MKIVSPIASIARGSIAGITATANQFQQIVFRARTAPVQPNTIMQTKVRTAFATAQTTWDGLTPVQRTAWEDYADTLTFTGPTGDYKVPGRQVFLSNFGWCGYLTERGVPGQTLLTAAPVIPGFATIQSLNVDTGHVSGTGYRVVGRNNNAENITVVVMNSRAFNPSRNRYKGPFKSDVIFSASVAPASVFGIEVLNLNMDMRYFCSVRCNTLEAGHRLSNIFYLNEIALEVLKKDTRSDKKKAA